MKSWATPPSTTESLAQPPNDVRGAVDAAPRPLPGSAVAAVYQAACDSGDRSWQGQETHEMPSNLYGDTSGTPPTMIAGAATACGLMPIAAAFL